MTPTKKYTAIQTPADERNAKTPATRTTKKSLLITLLSRKAGSDIPDLSERLGWQHHTTHAALSGLRKAGYELAVEKRTDGKTNRYRIVTTPPEKALAKERTTTNA